MSALELHFAMLGTDEDKAEEDVVQSLLGVLNYSYGSLERKAVPQHKIIRHMRSEFLRIHEKVT